ncbi:hypothetical protein C5167_036646 [Papaver somniferum]|uniref:Uncharacterized protein n=1 Tax=Papaver somniferum TaxID=3469 RepID=A0A4Y7I4B2_PAPSO|nr:hypothetical protein C5167_036646 [Papaver somniferum]
MANLLPLYLNHLPRNNFKPFSITTAAISPNGNGRFLSNNNSSSDPKTKSPAVGGRGPVIIEIPLNNIRRPLMRTK